MAKPKLTKEERLIVFHAFNDGYYSARELAKVFSISPCTVRNIAAGGKLIPTYREKKPAHFKKGRYVPSNEEWNQWKDFEYYPFPRFKCHCGCERKIPVYYTHIVVGIPNYIHGHCKKKKRARGRPRKRKDRFRRCANPYCNAVMRGPWWDKRIYCSRKCFLDSHRRPRAFITKFCPTCGKQFVSEYKIINGEGTFLKKYCRPGHNPRPLFHHTEEWKQRQSELRRGRKLSPEHIEKIKKTRKERGFWWVKYDLPGELIPMMKDLFRRDDWNEITSILGKNRINLLHCFALLGYMNGYSSREMAKLTGYQAFNFHRWAKRVIDAFNLSIPLPRSGQKRIGGKKSKLNNPISLNRERIDGTEIFEWLCTKVQKKF